MNRQFSMDRYPKFLRGENSESLFDGLIQDTRWKLEVLFELGIERTYIQQFDDAFSQVTPEDFLNKILYDKLKARLVVVGHDFRFGHKAAGDVALLEKWGKERGVEVIVIDPLFSNGELVSSTIIRKALKEGDLQKVTRLLGTEYSISGPVVPGNAQGRTVGMPTANVRIPANLLVPPYGVYVTRTRIGGKTYNSVTNIGTRPTVNQDESDVLMETVIFDYDCNLYGIDINVSFLHFLRPERSFNSFLTLTNQMSKDMQTARTWLDSYEQLWKIADQEGITTWVLPSDRFHSNVINVCLSSPADPCNSAAHAFLGRILSSCTREYPTKTALTKRLDELFGAELDVSNRREGDWQTIIFRASTVNRGMDDSKPFHSLVDLVAQMLLDPPLEEDGFLVEEIVERERLNFLSDWNTYISDYKNYVSLRTRDLLCGDQLHGTCMIGSIDCIASLSSTELTRIWRNWLKTAQIRVFVAGRMDTDLKNKVSNMWQEVSYNGGRIRRLAGREPSPFLPGQPIKVIEKAPLEMSRIGLMYSGLPPYTSYRVGEIDVLSNMLAAAAHSLLNDIVRLHPEAVHNISCRTFPFLSCLYIDAIVTPGKEDEVLRAVDRQLKKIVTGSYREGLFTSSLEIIKSVDIYF